ncbi:MAG: SDR family oxidoreductase [Myxococcota bacterium]|nr:SDR family oxidoreductase [Myxococcota bacterium]
MILVTGATGTVGREVVAQLVTAGKKVRALTRDPGKASFDARVEVVAGDLGKPETLRKALEGAERVFSLSTGPQLGVQERNLAAESSQAGVKHIVKLSVLGVGSGSTNPITGWHEVAEKSIRDSGIAWTFVRPGMFMSNALNWAPAVKAYGKIFQPYADGRIVPIHPRDVAAVAVKALTTPGHEGQSYPLTGPDALNMVEVAQILSEAVGKPIAYVPVTEEAARDGMSKAGVPALLVEGLMQLAAFVRSGGGQVLPTLERLLGRRGLTWREWARENASAFR